MILPKLRLGLSALAFASSLSLHAQALPNGDPDMNTGPNGVIPAKGFNLSLNTASQHDSSNGWTSILTPDVAFRFNRYFSADASIPIYVYIVAEDNKGTKAKPIYQYVEKNHVPGDAVVNGYFETHSDFLDYTLTATMGLPSGNTNYGLGAGKVTYAFNNHFEHSLFDFMTPDVELGIADASNLQGAPIKKSYVTVGTLAYFQAGANFELPLHMNFDAEAFEDLPVANTTVYSTTGKGKKKVTTATNEGAAEDNGFNTELDIPVAPHVLLSGFYTRSLRNKIDTAGFSLTFLLKPTSRPLDGSK